MESKSRLVCFFQEWGDLQEMVCLRNHLRCQPITGYSCPSRKNKPPTPSPLHASWVIRDSFVDKPSAMQARPSFLLFAYCMDYVSTFSRVPSDATRRSKGIGQGAKLKQVDLWITMAICICFLPLPASFVVVSLQPSATCFSSSLGRARTSSHRSRPWGDWAEGRARIDQPPPRPG